MDRQTAKGVLPICQLCGKQLTGEASMVTDAQGNHYHVKCWNKKYQQEKEKDAK